MQHNFGTHDRIPHHTPWQTEPHTPRYRPHVSVKWTHWTTSLQSWIIIVPHHCVCQICDCLSSVPCRYRNHYWGFRETPLLWVWHSAGFQTIKALHSLTSYTATGSLPWHNLNDSCSLDPLNKWGDRLMSISDAYDGSTEENLDKKVHARGQHCSL